MEILHNFLNSELLVQGTTLIAFLCVLGLSITYRIVIAPKLKLRKVRAKVKQQKYDKAIRKARHGQTFTWGSFNRSESSTQYQLKYLERQILQDDK